MTEISAEVKKCEHYWVWVSPAGTSNSARLCMLCHQPDANWLNTIFEMSNERPFCSDCPDHEACSTGWPCWMVKDLHDKERLK